MIKGVLIFLFVYYFVVMIKEIFIWCVSKIDIYLWNVIYIWLFKKKELLRLVFFNCWKVYLIFGLLLGKVSVSNGVELWNN